MCRASFFRPGLTDITFGGRAFLSRALLCALSRGEIRSTSSLTALEVCGNYRSLVSTRAQERVALVAGHLEVELVALDLGQLAGHHDSAAWCRRSEMADVNLVPDCGLAVREQAFQRLVACPLHESDHGRGRKGAFAAHVMGEQAAFDHTFQAPFEPRHDSV